VSSKKLYRYKSIGYDFFARHERHERPYFGHERPYFGHEKDTKDTRMSQKTRECLKRHDKSIIMSFN